MESPRNKINLRVLNDLKKRSAVGIVFYILLAAVVLSTDRYFSKFQIFSMVFFVSVLVTCILRFVHVIFFQRLSRWNETTNRILFIVLVLMTAIVWGSGFAGFMIREGGFYSKALMAICTAGLCAGGVVAFLPNRLLAILFNTLMMLPAFFVLLVQGVHLSLSIMIFFYFAYMLILTFRGNDEYWTALENEIKLQEQSETLKRMSRVDVLTGLYNRRYFNEYFESEWKRASREGSLCTIVLGDIDHFKRVNDSYGHLAGDAFLKKIAEILSSVFQRTTDLVARYGGEEFVILLPDTNTIQAFEMADKVRTKVEATTVYYDYFKIKTTVSFGIASVVPDFKESNLSLIGKVDKALYQAKQEGRNRIVIFKENLRTV